MRAARALAWLTGPGLGQRLAVGLAHMPNALPALVRAVRVS
jgi:hypothetical protein